MRSLHTSGLSRGNGPWIINFAHKRTDYVDSWFIMFVCDQKWIANTQNRV